MRAGRLRRRVVLTTLAVLLTPLAYLGYDRATYNFGAVEPGAIYRSGQMPAGALARAVRERRVKTVLNLRGSNPKQAWYRAERAATTGAGATQVDVAMASDQWMSRAQLRAVVKVLDTCERPVLVHCQFGSERTGLVSAFAALLRRGATLADARRQLSIAYLYVRAGDGKVMAEHLDRYEGWLAARGWAHSPERFRLWVAGGYQPGSPCREQWPYDPYPLLVVTRPGRADAGAGAVQTKAVAGKGEPTRR